MLLYVIIMFLNGRLEGRCYKVNARNFFGNTISPNMFTCHIFGEFVYRLSLYCDFVLEPEDTRMQTKIFQNLVSYQDVVALIVF
jgi:hypothetical protein